MRPAINAVVDRQNELLAQAESFIYKKIDQGPDLHAHVYYPEGEKSGKNRPVIMFFYSSSWDQGEVTQFGPQCLYFAGRGAITMLIEYRVKSTHDTGPYEAMADARTAIRWVRYNKDHFGVDELKIIGAGGMAGAHMVLSAAMIGDFKDDETDVQLSCVPDAMILFSPIVDTSKKGYGIEKFENAKAASKASPIRYMRKKLPPCLLFHGTADRMVPFRGVEKFRRKMKWRRNVCELIEFEGQDHSFYNMNVDVVAYEATISAADRFLVEQGFLESNEEDDGMPRLVSWRPQE
jgi:acetyl esterase